MTSDAHRRWQLNQPDPPPEVTILEFNASGPVLAVRPFCANADYWQVYFDANRAIAEEFGAAGFEVPAPQLHIRQLPHPGAP